MSQIKKATTETLRAKLEEAFYLASSKFKISYQRLAIRKVVVEKEDIFVNIVNQFQRTRVITSSTDKHHSLDSEDDSGCRNISRQQQFFSELHSPGRSHYTIRNIFVNLPKGSGKSSGRGVGRAKL